MPAWAGAEYAVVVTADHGHLPEGGHGGTHDDVVNTPLYVVTPSGDGKGDTGETVDHIRVAPTIWRLLGIGDRPADAGKPLEVAAS